MEIKDKLNRILLSTTIAVSLFGNINFVKAESNDTVTDDTLEKLLLNTLEKEGVVVSNSEELIDPNSLNVINTKPVEVIKNEEGTIEAYSSERNTSGYELLTDSTGDRILQIDSSTPNTFTYTKSTQSYNGQPVFQIIDGKHYQYYYSDEHPEPYLSINGGSFDKAITVDVVGAANAPNRDSTPQYRWYWAVSYDGGRTFSSDTNFSPAWGEQANTQITISKPGTVILRFRCQNNGNGNGIYFDSKPFYMNLDQDCSEVTYYSKKEWTMHNDFIDTDFNNVTSGVNSQDVLFTFSVLGTYKFGEQGYDPGKASMVNFLGQKTITKHGIGTGQEYGKQRDFSITFGSDVKVHQFEISIGAMDSKGNVIPHNIYKIKDYQGDTHPFTKELIATSTNNGKETFDLNGELIDSILVEFERNADDITYVFNGFQINNYETYDHVAWVTDYIADTEIMKQPYCKATGDYYPSSNITWQKSQESIFTPSLAELNSTVTYTRLSKDISYNNGWNANKNSFAINLLDFSPDVKRFLNNYGALNNIASWDYYNTYTLMPKTTEGYHLIPTNKTNGGRDVFVAVAANIMTCKNGSCDWRNIDLGCLGSNSRWWKWDPMMMTFAGGASQSNNYIKTIKYDLLDEAGNVVKTLATVNGSATSNLEELANSILITDTGKWKIRATLTNAIGMTVTQDSGLFYVDRQVPEIKFSKTKGEPTYNSTNVEVTVSDEHSGVEKWRYYISLDGGKTYDEPSEWITDPSKIIKIHESGENVIKVEAYDKVGNDNLATTEIFSVLEKDSNPVILAKDDVYLKNSEVTIDEVRKNAVAVDPVEGDISDRIVITSIEYPDRSEYLPGSVDTSIVTTIKVTFEVTNSKGVTVTTTHEYDIVTMDGVVKDEMEMQDVYNRFINERYIETLPEDSIWRKDSDYKTMLLNALQNKDVSIYSVDLEQSVAENKYTIQGVVKDDGIVIKDAYVNLYNGNTLLGTTKTDSAGHYIFENIPNGNYRVRASLQKMFGYTSIEVLGADVTAQDIELAFSSTVTGRVIVNDKKVANIEVAAIRDGEVIATTVTDAAGRFVLNGLESDAEYQIEVVTDAGTISKKILVDKNVVNTGDLIIKNNFAISGTVNVSVDTQLNGLVSVYRGGLIVSSIQLTKIDDKTYTFSVPNLSPGEYKIEIVGLTSKNVTIIDKDVVVNF